MWTVEQRQVQLDAREAAGCGRGLHREGRWRTTTARTAIQAAPLPVVARSTGASLPGDARPVHPRPAIGAVPGRTGRAPSSG